MKPMKPKHPDSVPAPREPQPPPSLAAPMLALAVFWLAAGQASAQSLDSLRVYPGFLTEAPSELPLDSREIPLRPPPDNGTGRAHGADVPTSVTGITMVIDQGFMTEFAAFEAKSASGADLDRSNVWSFERRRDMRDSFNPGTLILDPSPDKLTVLSFDGLEPGVNTIRFQLAHERIPSFETPPIYSLSVNRASEVSSAAELVALELYETETQSERNDAGAAYPLTPEFHADTVRYAVQIPPDRDRVTVDAEAEPWWARIEMRGTAADGNPLSIEGNDVTGVLPGANTVELNALAEDGTTVASYLVTVTREVPQGDATLHDVQLWESTPSRSLLDSAAAGRLATGDIRLAPGFAADVDRYTARTTASSLSLRAKAAFLSTVTAQIIGSDGASRGSRSSASLNADDGHYYGVTLSGLEPGNNVVEIAVVSDGGNRSVYRLDVERSVAAVARDIQVWNGAGPGAFGSFIGGILGGLAGDLTGDVELVPDFHPANVDYIAAVSGPQVTIQSEVDAGVGVAVSGRSASGQELSAGRGTAVVVDGNVDTDTTTLGGLVPGRNVITVTATADDGRTTEYTLHLIVDPATVPGNDDHGDDRASATAAAVDSDTPGALHAGDADYFRIDLDTAGRLAVHTTGGTDTFGQLEDAGGAVLATDDDGAADTNFRIAEDVPAGAWFVRVTGTKTARAAATRYVCASSTSRKARFVSNGPAGAAAGNSSPCCRRWRQQKITGGSRR